MMSAPSNRELPIWRPSGTHDYCPFDRTGGSRAPALYRAPPRFVEAHSPNMPGTISRAFLDPAKCQTLPNPKPQKISALPLPCASRRPDPASIFPRLKWPIISASRSTPCANGRAESEDRAQPCFACSMCSAWSKLWLPRSTHRFCPQNRVMSKNPVPKGQPIRLPIPSCRKIRFEGVNRCT